MISAEVSLSINMARKDSHIESCLLEYKLGPPVSMRLSCAHFGDTEVVAEDLFEALAQIRTKIEKEGFLLLCNGSRRDVYPSPMTRQMAKGRKAYILRSGIQARKEDLVDIFESATLEQVTTVFDQLENYRAWIGSL